MYTRCPSCSSTFRITATLLQMAAGEVRCGACGSVFNALDTLVDDWTGDGLTLAVTAGPAAPPAPQPILAAPPAGESAADEGGPADGTFEFNVPESEWQRFFLTSQEAPPAVAARHEPEPGGDFGDLPPGAAEEPAAAAIDPAPEEAALAPAAVGTLEEETADTDTWQGFLREAGLETGPAAGPAPEVDTDDADDAPVFVFGDEAGHTGAMLVLAQVPAGASGSAGAGQSPDPDQNQDTLEQPGLGEPAPEASTGWEAGTGIGADARAGAEAAPGSATPELEPAPAFEALATAETPAATATGTGKTPDTVLDWDGAPPFGARVPAAPAHAGRWFAASLVAALVLGAQFLHYSRDALAADPTWGAAVRALYARLGLPLDPDWPLDAYEIRSVKALVGNAPQGALDIAAEIAVTGRQPVGLPLLRVALRDRWSNIVASGVFGAADYLAETRPPTSLYAPGTLIPVQLSLKDPGAAAQGFELDVCMPSRQAGLRCKTAREPFRR